MEPTRSKQFSSEGKQQYPSSNQDTTSNKSISSIAQTALDESQEAESTTRITNWLNHGAYKQRPGTVMRRLIKNGILPFNGVLSVTQPEPPAKKKTRTEKRSKFQSVSRAFKNPNNNSLARILDHYSIKMEDVMEFRDEGGFTLFHVAANYNRQTFLQELLRECGCITAENFLSIRNKSGCTPLHTACRKVQDKIVIFLLKKYHINPLKLTNSNGTTPLDCAIKSEFSYRSHSMLNSLLDYSGLKTPQMATSYLNHAGKTVFHLSIGSPNKKTLKFLLNRFFLNSYNKILGITDSSGLTLYEEATIKGNTIILDFLLQLNRPVTNQDILKIRSKEGSTLLHICIEHGHMNVLEYFILNYGFKNYGKNSLILAVCNQSVKKDKSIIDIVDKDGNTLFHTAVKHGHKSILKYLFRYVNFYCKDDLLKIQDTAGNTIFHTAVEYGQQEILHELLNICDISTLDEILRIKNKGGQTLPETAIRFGKMEIFTSLLKQYFPKKLENISHLFFESVTYFNQEEILEFLLAYYDLNDPERILLLRDSFGNSLLHMASARGHINLLDSLLKKCQISTTAQILNIRNHHGLSILHTAIQGLNELMLDHLLTICEINSLRDLLLIRDSGGDTLFHTAAEQLSPDILKYLLQRFDRNSSLNLFTLKNNEGCTVIEGAIIKSSFLVVKYLLEESSCANLANHTELNGKRETLLHVAASYGHQNLLSYLLSHFELQSPDQIISIKDSCGRTLLHTAAVFEQKENLQHLLLTCQPSNGTAWSLTPTLKIQQISNRLDDPDLLYSLKILSHEALALARTRD